jgi:dipeptidyl aminopeptidase/acylaminoacyl peptidase
VALRTGRGDYRSLTFDRAGRQLAFVTNAAEFGRPKARFALVHARLDRVGPAGGAPDVRTAVAVDAAVVNGEPGLVVSDRGVSFARDGSALVFGLAPAPLDSVPADSLADKAVLDLWHYQEPRLQPQQRAEARRDRGRAYTAVYHPATGRAVRLGTDTLARVTLSDDGRTALAVAELPYALERLWGEGGNDLYVLDARTGARTLAARRVQFPGALSPGGRYVTWFADGRWRAYDVAARRTNDLTGALRGVRFDQETWDTPSDPAPWGEGGYTDGERDLLLYSRYDVWAVDPSGRRAPRVVTDSAGARNTLVLRVAKPTDDRTIDPAAPLVLTAFDDRTKASGFYVDRVDGARAPERVVMADARFGAPVRARDAELYMVTRQSFAEAPDVYAGVRLDSLRRLTESNPQQREYAWGTAELVAWRSLDGAPLQGVLYKPAGFDPRRRYPMLVYFYEQLSHNLHQYHAPAGRNVVNPTVYASNGYVVFFPDIAYANGYPGQSALKSILPGVQAIAARGFVDERRVGIAGQSWGGYQSAHIITQTPYFRAAFLGAPVANMTSAYGGIRWETGLARAFQYEKGQSRIGRSPWDALPRYIENSPLFYVDRVTTPMLIMSNDADGAVPWYQGIELFVGARRFGKEAYLVNYNGDGHNPRKRANQLDIDRRMQQFFGHHLKGEPAPDWMREGVPFLRKGRDQLAPAATVAGAAPGREPAAGQPQPAAGQGGGAARGEGPGEGRGAGAPPR